MKEIITLIVSWIPVPTLLAGLIIIGKSFVSKIKSIMEVPEKLLGRVEELRGELVRLNKENQQLREVNDRLHEDVEKLLLAQKGITDYGSKVGEN